MEDRRLNPTLSTLVDAIVRDVMLRIRTHAPARVISYAAGPPALVKVEVSPQQVERDEDGNEGAREPYVLADVPVWHLGDAVSYVNHPVQTGATGMLLVCDRSIGGWRSDGGAHPPPAPWLHNLGECVFLPGFRPDSAGIAPATMGGAVVESTTIQLGVAAALGAARVTDPTVATAALIAYFTAITALSTAMAATADGAPVLMTPAVRAAVAALTPALQAPAVASTTTILSGSTKTFIE